MTRRRQAVAPGVSTLLITRPSAGLHVIDRPRLWASIDRLLAEHHVVLVTAPAGFGKTTALSTWAERTDKTTAWLSLTESDRHPEQLARGLDAAVGAASGGSEPVLVIDDIHLTDADAARAVLTPLLEHPPAGLRIVLSGRGDPGLGLTRLEARGELGRLDADDLAFSADDVDLAGRAMRRPISADRASRLWSSTGGWPVAVRLALIATPPREAGPLQPVEAADIPRLAEYLIENVLGSLPEELAAFVPRACTCEWLTGELANTLWDGPTGARLLEDALAAGLPLERRGSFQGQPVYRWHRLMAHAGRAILRRRDPQLALELDRRAARALGALDPVGAARHALRGRDPELAAELVRSQWLAAVLRGDFDLVEELCLRLPSPWSEDAEILAVRAACRRYLDDLPGARALDRRAEAAAVGLPDEARCRFELTQLLTRLFVLDDAGALGDTSTRALDLLTQSPGAPGVQRAGALLLIGWTELRLRHARVAAGLLRQAEPACRAEGLDDLAERARANHAFALAFQGDFAGSEASLAGSSWGTGRAAPWRRSDGAIEWFAAGWIRYWTGDSRRAIDAFTEAAEQGGGLISYAQLAACWLVNAAVDAGHAPLLERALSVLAEVPDATVGGLPWRTYKGVARAGVALALGRTAEAERWLDDAVSTDEVIPAASSLAAGLYWRCGRLVAARAQAARLGEGVPAYLQVEGLVVTALCARRDGATEAAHDALEEALSCGASQGLLRSFSRPDAELAALLAEHQGRETRHEAFLAEAIARQGANAGDAARATLSQREWEVLSHLGTSATTAEIAAALFISPNTLKSHLKAIYRKLGVETRRDAVRVARARRA